MGIKQGIVLGIIIGLLVAVLIVGIISIINPQQTAPINVSAGNDTPTQIIQEVNGVEPKEENVVETAPNVTVPPAKKLPEKPPEDHKREG